ncbi:hypothetical protein PWT90_10658 [Aphanocladium album]|nr:hypothetical protein PWT90_10658 [Aphanocladium album]
MRWLSRQKSARGASQEAADSAAAAVGTAMGQQRRVERNAINTAELQANSQRILTTIHTMRPDNTRASYQPKQAAFQAFCQAKQYHDYDTVTEDKLLLFLVEEVANRPLQGRSHRVSPGSEETSRLSWRSVRTYVTAVTDLYRTQKACGMNTHPSPREDNVRDYLKTLQRRDAERDKASFLDKGRDTLLDGYSEQELERVCAELWAHSVASPECHFRTLIDLLLGHYMLTRGSDRRATEISDIFTFEFKNEGSTRCMPLILTTRGSKQNQHGRLKTAGALRNRQPLVCLLGALAFYFLLRWDLTEEPFPDLSHKASWYKVRLIRGFGNDSTATFSYNSQRDWVVKAFGYAGIHSKKKTHIGRSSGAKTAELKGVSEEQIRRAGRWNQEQIVGCYLSALPRKFMRVMAGHPAQPGCFEVRRANLTPPDTLLSLIWPDLDQWKGRQVDDLATAGFIDLLLYLREVILQDSVALKPQFPASPIWNHPVFQHPEYRVYSQQLQSSIQEAEQPSQLTILTQAIPILTEYLKSIDAKNESRIVATEARLQAEIISQSTQLQALLSGGLTVHLQAALSTARPSTATGLAAATTTATTAAPSPAATALLTGPRTSLETGPEVMAEEAISVPQYRMCRTVKTVEALWQEWTIGLNGQLSILELNRRWGNKWRAGRQSELQWYSLRLEVIKEIQRLAQAQRTSENTAMQVVNHQHQKVGCSIDQLCKQLRRKIKEGHGNSDLDRARRSLVHRCAECGRAANARARGRADRRGRGARRLGAGRLDRLSDGGYGWVMIAAAPS